MNPNIATHTANPSPHKRILVVDDDPILRELMGETLTSLSFSVASADNGMDAFGIIENEDLDLAIVDLSMPQPDGFALLQHIRSHPRAANLPVIVATSSGDRDSIEKAYRLGASSFVTKPINWAQFVHHAQFVMRTGQTERALRAAQAEAAIASRMKNGLFNILGHELKTPLTALIGFADVLATSMGSRLEPREEEYLRLISDAAGRLNHTVGDILILSRALAGNRTLEKSTISARTLLEECLLGLRSKSKEREINVIVDVVPDTLDIKGDDRLLHQALRRLADNAVKFSPQRGQVWLSAERDADGCVLLTVKDEGPGISKARLRDCLQPFMQADMSYSRPAEGLGLGLPIAHAIAEVHGGELLVTTTPGEGLAATIRLPAEGSVKSGII